jgi:2-polyprenyl-3-methyl-5-hydroxy-6-metoxy-1,4-benzoquinol methylase
VTDAASEQPAPDVGRSAADIRDFYDRFLAHLIRDRIRPNARHRIIRRFIRAQITPGCRVLDLGCGIGVTTGMIHDAGADVIGVDLSPQLIAYARETVPGPEFLTGNITELALDGRFDRICLFDCLEHVPRAEHPALVRILAAHAASDARMLITVPDPWLLDYTRQHEPERLQIVDESIDTAELVQHFADRGFFLAHMQRYDVDYVHEYQLLVFQRQPQQYRPVRLPKSPLPIRLARLLLRPGWWIARALRRRRYAGPALLERVRRRAESLTRPGE